MDPEDMLPAKPTGVVLGEDLSRLSVLDLEARLGALEAERQRVEAEIRAKRALKASAEAIFKT